ncbi:MAG: type II toxin-antitoxin system Phd/YefM family antitoxin [Planctomycetaceae bacterium]|nr:type II toxin-antitoxin system Phd/YefM family antitoxin [Planctomycetaceae bacterium]
MTTVTIEEAQAKLKELIHQLGPGEELIITDNQQTVAKLVGESPPTRKQRPGPGLLKGRVVYMAADFNEPLDDLKEHLE